MNQNTPLRPSTRMLQMAFVIVVVSLWGSRPDVHVDAQGGAALCNPVIDHLEFIQSIQDGQGASADIEPVTGGPVVPIIEQINGKLSAVRAYVYTFGTQPCVLAGKLTATANGQQMFIIRSYNAHLVAPLRPPPFHWARNQENSTVNFEFGLKPLGELPLSFKVCLGVVDPVTTQIHWKQDELCFNQSVQYKTVLTPRIVGYPVSCLNCIDTSEPDPNLIKSTVVDMAHWLMYPFPTRFVNFYRGSTYQYDGNAEGGYILGKPDLMQLVEGIGKKRRKDNPEATAAYGFVRDNLVRRLRGTGKIEHSAATGNTYDSVALSSWVFTHELVHIYGQEDVDGTTDMIGWNVARLLGGPRLKPTGLRELRDNSGSNPNAPPSIHDVWIGSTAYNDIASGDQGSGMLLSANMSSVAIEYAPQSITALSDGGQQARRTISGGGDQSWTLMPSSVITSSYAMNPSGSSPGQVRILDSNGNVLLQQDFSTSWLGEDWNGDPFGDYFMFDVPVMIGEHRIDLYKSSVLQDSIVRSSHMPIVTINQPTSGSVVPSVLNVDIEVSDADNDPLLLSVSYSHDDGDTWTSLATDDVRTTYAAPTDRLPASDNGILLVSVTDGMNTSFAEVHSLSLGPNRAPDVAIASPIDGSTQKYPSNVILLAYAKDLEDAQLPDFNYSWYSNIDGPIGSGVIANWQPLTPGVHQIELRVSDSGGATTSSFVSITITP